MDFSSAKSERITAIVSTLVAVAILAGGVTAYQSRTAPIEDIVQLESDLRFQLEVGFRHDANERAARLRQLKAVTGAWRQSPRASADREKLADWLLEATIRSMPGSIEPLPATPKFGQQTPQPTIVHQPDVLLTPRTVANQLPEPIAGVPVAASFASTDLAQPETEVSPFEETFSNAALIEQTPEEIAVPQLPTLATVVAAPPITINLTELAARIAGYHDGLNELERTVAKLDAADMSGLAEQVRLLGEIAQDFQFVKLYYETLSPTEQRALTAPRSLTAALEQIEKRLEGSHESPSGDFLNEFDASHQDRISTLRRQVAEIAVQADQ